MLYSPFYLLQVASSAAARILSAVTSGGSFSVFWKAFQKVFFYVFMES